MRSEPTTVTSQYWERKAQTAHATARRLAHPKARSLMLSVARKCRLVAATMAKEEVNPSPKAARVGNGVSPGT